MLRLLKNALPLLIVVLFTVLPSELSREGAGPLFNGIVIAAVGDIMMPASIQDAVARNGNRYEVLFERIAGDLSADIGFGNLETPVDHRLPLSGYPRFNADRGLLTALRQAGINVLSVANNHALDAGPSGLRRTLENIRLEGMQFTGAGRSRAEARRITVVEARGIRVAFLAFTYGTNAGMPRRKKGLPRVNILRAGSDQELAWAAARVRRARAAADIVVVSLHWSDEYRTKPTAWQRKSAALLIDAGADVILGHHPHVLQAIGYHRAKNGRRGFIAYSLGNFISSQNKDIWNRNRTLARALRGDGIILRLFARKGRAGGKAVVTGMDFLPIWTLRERVGKTVVQRPVCIAREIARLSAKQPRTEEEDDNLSLLAYRQKVIRGRLAGGPRSARHR